MLKETKPLVDIGEATSPERQVTESVVFSYSDGEEELEELHRDRSWSSISVFRCK